MQYLAILKTDDEEFMCLADSPGKAKVGIFNGHNTFIKKILETKHSNPLQDVTSEWLATRLEKYYTHYLKGKVSIETLEKAWKMTVMEIESDKCYRDGSETPLREQDY